MNSEFYHARNNFKKKSLPRPPEECSFYVASNSAITNANEEDAPRLVRLRRRSDRHHGGGFRSGATPILPQEPGAPALGSQSVSVQRHHGGLLPDPGFGRVAG